jgi:uncharacterized protein YlaI
MVQKFFKRCKICLNLHELDKSDLKVKSDTSVVVWLCSSCGNTNNIDRATIKRLQELEGKN